MEFILSLFLNLEEILKRPGNRYDCAAGHTVSWAREKLMERGKAKTVYVCSKVICICQQLTFNVNNQIIHLQNEIS